MKISERTISALGKVITGDGGISPYQSGPNLIHFFNEFGFNDVYGSGFPSRWVYGETKIRALNDSPTLIKVIEAAFDPRHYLGTDFDIEEAVAHLNQYLKYDGYKLEVVGDFYKIKNLKAATVKLENVFDGSEQISHQFIEQQLTKCDEKIRNGDYDGAITNSRSLVEAVLIEIESNLSKSPIAYDGNLIKLYKRVQHLLNLHPGQKDIADSIKQVLSGLTSIVLGLSSLRNKMGDAHAPQYKPLEHHARLAVNSAKTITDFVWSVYLSKEN